MFLIFSWDNSEQPALQAIQHPQEYMKGIAMRAFTEEGTLKDELEAAYWAYLPEFSESKLTAPRLTVYKPDKSIWHIVAQEGTVHQPKLGAIEQVELRENVVVERPALPTLPPIKVETSLLRYQPKTEYAETDQYITLSKPDLKITGVGMRAFLDKNSVEILNDVKTYYVAK